MLVVRDLNTTFPSKGGSVRAVEGLSFSLEAGETMAIVGESGSGKSVTNLSILGLVDSPPAVVEAAEISFKGRDLLGLSEKDFCTIRGREIAFVFQDPMTSLNPFMKIEKQLSEVLELHTDLSKAERHERIIEMLHKVGIGDAEKRAKQFPHELSGGMRQRVLIAMALLCSPSLLIADEPTTALDVTIQAQILELIADLVQQTGTALILVSHDLGVVAGMAQKVMVMYAGQMMEMGRTEDILSAPRHPYTRALLKAVPRLEGNPEERLFNIEGLPPTATNRPEGCPFAPRCDHREAICDTHQADVRYLGEDHQIRCHVDLGEVSA